MFGQYRILGEILIFAVGVAITSYVALSFTSVREFISSASAQDKMENTASNIINAVVRASAESSVLVIEIPEKISEREYTIKVLDRESRSCDKGDDCFLNLTATDASVSRQLFNISQNYNIKGDVHSTARFLSVSMDRSKEQITVDRA